MSQALCQTWRDMIEMDFAFGKLIARCKRKVYKQAIYMKSANSIDIGIG